MYNYQDDEVTELRAEIKKRDDEIERLREALHWVVEANRKENIFQSADFHGSKCRCSRCSIDHAEFTLQQKESE